MSHQPAFRELFDVPASVTREKVRRVVRQVSIEQYKLGREMLEGRKADVLRWLAHYANRWQHSPTSAELSRFCWHNEPGVASQFEPFEFLIHCRRGLSDLQTVGLVESVPVLKAKRVPCAVSGKRVERWRVTQVGRQKF